MALERDEYRRLVRSVVCTSRRNDIAGVELSCIGNAAGADNMVRSRPSGGMLLRSAGRALIVDPGSNSLSCLASLGIDPYSITDVLASHAHDDHVGNLSAAVSAALKLGLSDAPDCHVIVCPALIDYSCAHATRSGFTLPAFAWRGQVHALYWEDVEVERFDGVRIRSQRQVRVGDEITVTATPARHGPIRATGFVIDTPLGRLGYTADTEYFAGLADAYRGSDVLWVNLNTLDLHSQADLGQARPGGPEPVHGHLGYRGVCQLLEEVRPKTAVVSHFGAQLTPRREAIERLLRDRFSASGMAIHCPANGDRLSFSHGLSMPPRLSRLLA